MAERRIHAGAQALGDLAADRMQRRRQWVTLAQACCVTLNALATALIRIVVEKSRQDEVARRTSDAFGVWHGSCLVTVIRRIECNMFRSTRLLRFVFAALLTFGSLPAWSAGTKADEFVQSRHGQLSTLLQLQKSSTREKKVAASIDEVFDYKELATRSLGQEWEARSDAERAQFQELLERLVRQSYRKSIDATLGYAIEYRGVRKSGGDTIVTTVATHKTDSRKAPVSIEYVLVPAGDTWRAVDVIIEGSSLVANYRSQFTRVIKKKGFSELVARMKHKLAKGEK